MSTFKKKLANLLIDDDELEIYNLSSVNQWPKVDYEGEQESLDMENFEILSLTDNQLVVCCGGDWQDPLTVTIELVEEELCVTSSTEGYEDGTLDEDELFEALSPFV